MRGIKQLEGALGRKTRIARGRAIRAVCMALGVSCSNVLTKKTRSTDWAGLRKSPLKLEDADLKDAFACVVKDRATFGYNRVYRVIRDEGWLLFRQGQKPLDTRKHEGTVP